MQIKYISFSLSRPPDLLRKAGVIVATVAMAGVALMFSAVLLVLVLIVVAFGGAYLWWKTRELRKQLRNFPPPFQRKTMQSDIFAGEVFTGEMIEGDAIRVDESRGGINR